MSKGFKRFLAVALSVLTTVSLAACTQTTETSTSETSAGAETTTAGSASAGDKMVVGYVINNLNDTFQTYILEAAQKYADENNMELSVQDSQEDTIKQQDHVKTLIENGVDALVVVPTDTSAMEPITKAATEAGIPLVYVNRNPFSGKEDSLPDNVFYVGSDEKSGGQMQMEYIGEQIGGEGGVAILLGILGNEATTKRTEGVEEVIASTYPNVKVLTKETGNWQREEALSLTENYITAYGDELKAIVANNDEMALGAIQALKNNNLLDKVAVAGLDAIPDALAAVEDGTMECTVFQDAVGQGTTAVQIINDVKNGKQPEQKVQYIPFQLVTKENVADFKK